MLGGGSFSLHGKVIVGGLFDLASVLHGLSGQHDVQLDPVGKPLLHGLVLGPVT